jgi:hypothetical protein
VDQGDDCRELPGFGECGSRGARATTGTGGGERGGDVVGKTATPSGGSFGHDASVR